MKKIDNHKKWTVFLFEKLTDKQEVSFKSCQALFYLNLIQFLSVNLDQNFWDLDPFFQTKLLDSCTFFLKPFQFDILFYLPNLKPVIYFFWFSICIIISLLYVGVFFKKHANLLNKWISGYQRVFPLIMIPFMETILCPFYDSSLNESFYIFFSVMGLTLFFTHFIINVFIFNESSFNKNNRMNRIVNELDVWNHLGHISPILIGLFMRFPSAIYLSLIFQLISSLLLFSHYQYNLIYFDVKIFLIYGKILCFKIFFLILMLFGVIIQIENQIFLLLNASFAYVLARNLIEYQFFSFLFSYKDKKNSNKHEDDGFKQTIMRSFMIFSYFFYQENIDSKNFFLNFRVKIPLQFISFLSKKDQKKENIQVFGFEQIKNLKENLRNHILEICEEMKFLKNKEIKLFSILMPFFLAEKPRLLSAVRLIEKIQRKRNSFSLIDKLNFLFFIETVKKKFNCFENEQISSSTINENSLIYKTTNFFPKRFYEFDLYYQKLSNKIEKYHQNITKFLDNLKNECPNISLLEENALNILKLKKEIAKNFCRGEENPVYIYKYFKFLQIFLPDSKREIIRLIKKFNSLKILERMPVKENAHIYDFIIETLTFSTNSSFLYVSGCSEQLGRILKIDDRFLALLEYKEKIEIVGNNINSLIPNIIAENHQHYMEVYLKTGESHFTFKEQNLFFKKKAGELVNFNMTVKPHLMEIDNKLIFFCHLKSNFDRKAQSVVILDELGFIDSFGGSISELLGPLFKEYGQRFYIQMFMPNLHEFFINRVMNKKKNLFEEKEENTINFFFRLEKYQNLCDKASFQDKKNTKNFLKKIKDNFEEINCGASLYCLNFELKYESSTHLNYFVLYIYNLTDVGFKTIAQRKNFSKRKVEEENFLSIIPDVKTNHQILAKQRISLKKRSTFITKPNKSCEFFEKSKTIKVILRKSRSDEFIMKTKTETTKTNIQKKTKSLFEKQLNKKSKEKNQFFEESKHFNYTNSSESEKENLEENSQEQASVSSGLSATGKELRENFYNVITIDAVPLCYTRYVIFHIFLFLLAIVSLVFLSLLLSSTISTISSGFNQTFLIENFKIRFLKTLFYAHKFKKFKSVFELSKINDQGKKMAVDIIELLNPPFNNINNQLMDVYMYNKTVQVSSIDAINLFNSLSIDSVKHPYKIDMIISNGLNIFKYLEAIANILEILLGLISNVKSQLIIYSTVVAFLATIVVLFQIFNLTLCYNFINENFRKLLTIPNKEIQKFLDSLQEYETENNGKNAKKNINNKKDKNSKSETNPKYQKSLPSISKNSQNKTKLKLKFSSRKKHPVDLIKFPVLKSFLIATTSLSVFCCFVVIILYKSNFIDQTLMKFLKGEVGYQRSKAYNYMYIIRRANKLYLNNLYNYDEAETLKMFETVRDGVNILLTHSNDFDGNDQVQYIKLINQDLCEKEMFTFPLAANFSYCGILAQGQYKKGIVGALSFANLLFEQDLAGAFDLNIQPNIDLLDFTIILFDRKLRNVAQNTLNLMSNNLQTQNNDSFNLNIVFLIITAGFLSGFYLFFLKHYLKKRLLQSKLVFQIIPSKILFTSSAIKTYLRKLFEENIKKN